MNKKSEKELEAKIKELRDKLNQTKKELQDTKGKLYRAEYTLGNCIAQLNKRTPKKNKERYK